MNDMTIPITSDEARRLMRYDGGGAFDVLQARAMNGACKLVVKRLSDNTVWVAYFQGECVATLKPAKVIEYG